MHGRPHEGSEALHCQRQSRGQRPEDTVPREAAKPRSIPLRQPRGTGQSPNNRLSAGTIPVHMPEM